MLSMSESLSCRIGNSAKAMASASRPSCLRRSGARPANGRPRSLMAAAYMRPFPSGLIGGDTAQDSGGAEHQHGDEDAEDDHVHPGRADELASQRLDQPDDDAAEHGTGHVADAAQYGRGEGSKPGVEADEKAG